MDSDDLSVGGSSSPLRPTQSGPSRRPRPRSEIDPTTPRHAPPVDAVPPHYRPQPLGHFYGSPMDGGGGAVNIWAGSDPRTRSRTMDVGPSANSTLSPGSSHSLSGPRDAYAMSRNLSNDSQRSVASQGSQRSMQSQGSAPPSRHHFLSPGGARPSTRSDSPGRREDNERPSQAPSHALSEPASRSRSPPRPRRTRVLMTRMQWTALTSLWDKTIFPATNEREALAQEIGLTARQVQVWFQNQRQKRRREREIDEANAINLPSAGDMPRTAEAAPHWAGSISGASNWSMQSAPAHLQTMPATAPRALPSSSIPVVHGRPPPGGGQVPPMSHLMHPPQPPHSPHMAHGQLHSQTSPIHYPGPLVPQPSHHPTPSSAHPQHHPGHYRYPDERDARLPPPPPQNFQNILPPPMGGMPGGQPPAPGINYGVPVDRWEGWGVPRSHQPPPPPASLDGIGPTRPRSRSFATAGRPYPAPAPVYSSSSPRQDHPALVRERASASSSRVNTARTPPAQVTMLTRLDTRDDRLALDRVSALPSQTLSPPSTATSLRGGSAALSAAVRASTGPTPGSSVGITAPMTAQRVSSLPPSLSALVLDRPVQYVGDIPPPLSPQDPSASLHALVLEPEPISSPSSTRDGGDHGGRPSSDDRPATQPTSATLPSLAHLLN